MSTLWLNYSDYLARRFDGKMQKLTVNTGLSCPNRDGTISTGGCTYCNNAAFSPQAIGHGDVSAQLAAGKAFFSRKYPRMRFLAYFQSYTNTHAAADTLLPLFKEALDTDGIDGLIIGTRPDCVDLHLLREIRRVAGQKYAAMEFGAESTHNETLRLVNRCHTWECTVGAVEMARQARLDVGLHFIMGLPGETTDMMLQTVDRINALRPDTVKFHQLQIIRGTEMARQHAAGTLRATLFDTGEYLDLCTAILDRLDPSIAVERFTASAPSDLLIAPRWGLKNHEFTNLLANRLAKNGVQEDFKVH